MTIHVLTAGLRLGVGAVAAVLLAGSSASAGIVSYTLTGQLDGSVGSTPLVDAPFTWTLKADNLMPTQAAGLPALQAILAEIRLGGVGVASFVQPTYLVQNTPGDLFAFTDQAVTSGVGWTSPAFATNLLGDALSPRAVDFNVAAGALDTSLGALQVTDLNGLVFSASSRSRRQSVTPSAAISAAAWAGWPSRMRPSSGT